MSSAATASLWKALGGRAGLLESVSFSGEPEGLASRFEVGALASATVAVAALAVAELWSARTAARLRRVHVDQRLAATAFRCERLLEPQGWTLPERTDPVIGDYRGSDGWIRLHTNYPHHRDAALRVLGATADKSAVSAAVARWNVAELESAVLEAGGCAAALRSREDWSRQPQGRAVAAESVVAWHGKCAREPKPGASSAPLSGIRVLDLTRVIAGPVGSRFLAAHGADVLRIDPPGFNEGEALLAETTMGKRCASLNLKKAGDRKLFQELVSGADVLLHGYRPRAMESLGYDEESLRKLNPALAIVRHNAYGWSGPWADRRGFDSLVQMSSGIAHPGNDGAPTPLPAQALDHGTGFLLAAAACRALTGGHACARLSLARTARLLVDLERSAPAAQAAAEPSELYETVNIAWGALRRIRSPGEIEGYQVYWRTPAGPLGRHEPRWL